MRRLVEALACRESRSAPGWSDAFRRRLIDCGHGACEGGVMEKSSLTALAREQLKLARQAASGRSADTVYGGHERILRQTVIALVAGRGLSEHENRGEATVYVLQGRVRLHGKGHEWEGSPGDLLIVPEVRHSLDALEDSVVLLTVAKAN